MASERCDQASAASTEPMPPENPAREETVLQKCKRAMAILRRGDCIEALAMTDEWISGGGSLKKGDLAMLYRLHGTISYVVAFATRDSEVRFTYLEFAVESARRATRLSPDSIEFSHFLSFSLSKLVDKSKKASDYVNVVEECERGLGIEDPQDTFEVDLQVVATDMGDMTIASRIENIRRKMRLLLETCRLLVNLANVEKNSVASDEVVKGRGARLERRAEGKRKHGKVERVGAKREDRVNMVRSFWETMSMEWKIESMKVRIDELKQYFKSLKICSGVEVFEEAIAFVMAKKTWKYWECGVCRDMFLDGNAYLFHFSEEHAKKLDSQLQKLVPLRADSELVDTLLKGDWKPVDAVAATKLISDKSRAMPCDGDPITDFGFQPPLIEHDENGWSKTWPLIHDAERESILKDIHKMFQLFVHRMCLTERLAKFLIAYANQKMKPLIPDSMFIGCGLEGHPQSICFLGVTELEIVLEYLQRLASHCGVHMDMELCRPDGGEIKETISFDSDFTSLVLDERLLQGELRDAVDDQSSRLPPATNDPCNELPNHDATISWLYKGPKLECDFEFQKHLREERKVLCKVLIDSFEAEFNELVALCLRKKEIQEHWNALLEVKRILTEEREQRKEDSDAESDTYKSLLMKKVEELSEGEGKAMCSCVNTMLHIISHILGDPPCSNDNERGSEGSSIGFTCLIRKLVSHRNEDRIQESFEDEEKHVEEAMTRLNTVFFDNLVIEETFILLKVEKQHQMELDLALFSSYDYQSIILPILRSFMREKLENLVDKAAREKSDAAMEALLADFGEEPMDSRKPRNGRKGTQESSKAAKAKRSKVHRKEKDSKVIHFSKSPMFHQELAEPEPSIIYQLNPSKSVVVVTLSEAELKRREAEQQLEIEERDRKLKENSENVKQSENETEEKCPAENEDRSDNDAKDEAEKLQGLEDLTLKEKQTESNSKATEPQGSGDLGSDVQVRRSFASVLRENQEKK